MALSNNRAHRIITLCGLYVAQGVPWGFMLITLPAYLSFTYQVSDAQVGALKAIILVPWSFKLIWAPIMDSFTIRSMGRRRPWIIGAELMMALTLVGFIFVGVEDPSEELTFILAMYVLHNIFASLQDVCTDALAVDILPPNEQGQTNGMMWGSKLVGRGIGAYGLSVVLKYGGLAACVAVQIVLLLLIMLIPILLLERPGEKRFPWSKGAANTKGEVKTARNPLDVLKAYVKAFSLPTTLVYIVFTLAKLIGAGVNEVVANVLFTQHLDPVWTDVEYSKVSGLWATAPIILGALAGGFLADKFGRRKILIFGLGGYGLLAILFGMNMGMWSEGWFATSYVIGFETLNAIFSVGFLSMAMRISWTAAAATVFTTYMTLSNVSHVAGNALAGPIRNFFTVQSNGEAADLIAYQHTFFFVGAVSILPLLLLIWVRPSEVDEAKKLNG